MESIIKIAMQERANLSIAEARQISNALGTLVTNEKAVRAAILKFKFKIK